MFCKTLLSIPRPGKFILRTSFFLLLSLAVLQAALAQHNLVLYNMQQIPQSNLINPAQIPLVKGYFGLPVLSGVRLGGGSSGFNYNDFDRASMTDAYDFDYDGLSSQLKSGVNRVMTDTEIRLLSFGSRVGKGYVNFDIGDVFYTSGNHTPDMWNMFHDIQQNNLLSGQMDTTYNQSQQAFSGAYYRSYSVSYAHQVFPNLSVGGRFRYLQGVAGVWTDNQNLMLHYPGDGDYFQVMGRMDILAAGVSESDESSSVFSRLFPGGNSGFAFDFGGVYRITDRIEASFSAVNIGQINWKKNVTYQVVSNPFEFSAVDIDEHVDSWLELGENLVDLEPDTTGVRFTTPLPMRFYLGGNYYFRPNTSVGLVVNPVLYNGTTDVAVALSGNTRLGKVLGLSAAMAFNRYQAFNLGAGLTLDLGVLQIYAITDNLPAAFNWRDAQAVQAQFGLNFNFGSMKREETMPEEDPVAEAYEEAREDFFPAAPPERETYNTNPSSEPVAPRQEITAPAPPEPAPAAALEPVPSEYFTLTGTARDAGTGDILKGIRLDAYRINQQGEKELVYTGSFYNGNLSVPLTRGYSYALIVERRGFDPKEIALEASQVSRSAAAVQRDFVLREAEANSPAPPQKADPQPTPPQMESPPAYEAPLTAPPQPAPQQTAPPTTPTTEPSRPVAPPGAQPDLGAYRLTGSTSLRIGPHHTTNVILRLRQGDEVRVLEQSDRWWWKVRFQNRVGYVKSQMLEQ